MIALLLSLQPNSPGDDPLLASPTQLAVVMEPVASAIAPLGKAKGVILEVAPVLQDRKIALHTEKESLGKTLDQLAVVLDGKWTSIPNGWRLDPLPERMTELASFLKLRKEQARQAAEKNLLGNLAIVRKMTFPDYVAETRRLEKAAEETKNDDEQQKLEAAREKLGYMTLMGYMAAYTYGTLSAGEQERFWNGEVFYATSAAFPGGRAIPEGSSHWKDVYDPEDEPDRGDMRVFLRFDPIRKQLGQRLDRDGSVERSVPNIAPPEMSEAEANHPFIKRQIAWNQPELFPSRWEDPVAKLPDPGKGPWYGGYWSVADSLARFHKRTGLPVVAMTGRKPWRVNNPDDDRSQYDWASTGRDVKLGTLGASLVAQRSTGGQMMRENGGYLLLRPRDWFDRLEFEPPEPALREFEKKEGPTIDDYAVLATHLTEAQAFLLGRSSEAVLRYRPYPFTDGPSMLRLWGSLSAQQRALVRKGGSISYESMNGALRTVFEAAVLNGIMDGASIGESAKVAFDGPWDGSLFKGVSIWGETQGIEAIFRGTPVPQNPDKDPTWNGGEKPMPGIRFTLGRAPGDGFVYTMENPEP